MATVDFVQNMIVVQTTLVLMKYIYIVKLFFLQVIQVVVKRYVVVFWIQRRLWLRRQFLCINRCIVYSPYHCRNFFHVFQVLI
jgi:hypothetical protein